MPQEQLDELTIDLESTPKMFTIVKKYYIGQIYMQYKRLLQRNITAAANNNTVS